MPAARIKVYLPSQWPPALKYLALASLVLHLSAGYFGLGYYHADEHFQILEFARVKLTGDVVDMPWEHREQMRPWLQPAVVYAVAKAWKAIGVHDPFVWVNSLQIVTALVGWLLMGAVAICTPLWIKRREHQHLAIGLAFFLWFLPYLQARLSSENWSSLAMWFGVLALSFLWQRQKLSLLSSLGIGFLFGLAFDFRFQIGFALIGVAAWCILERLPFKTLATMFVGILMAVGLGAVADHWGYGEWVFSPWQYLRSNVVDDKLSTFGVSPWWDYFRRILLDATPPLGVVLVLGTLAGWRSAPRSVLTLSTAIFVLVHFFIGHKETRFFFPLAPVLPILLVQGWEYLRVRSWFRPAPKLVKGLAIALAVLNGCLLLGASVIPARTEMPYERYIYRSDVRKLHYVRLHPFDFGGLAVHFYRPKGMELVRLMTWDELAKLPYAHQEKLWVHSYGLDYPAELQATGARCELRHSSMNGWVRERFRPIWKISKTLVLSLYECDFPKR